MIEISLGGNAYSLVNLFQSRQGPVSYLEMFVGADAQAIKSGTKDQPSHKAATKSVEGGLA